MDPLVKFQLFSQIQVSTIVYILNPFFNSFVGSWIDFFIHSNKLKCLLTSSWEQNKTWKQIQMRKKLLWNVFHQQKYSWWWVKNPKAFSCSQQIINLCVPNPAQTICPCHKMAKETRMLSLRCFLFWKIEKQNDNHYFNKRGKSLFQGLFLTL